MNSPQTPQRCFDRRKLLCALGAALATPFVSAPVRADIVIPATGGRLDDLLSTIDPHLEVANVNTGEHMATDFVERGSYDDRALNSLDWFFRDWRNDQGTVMDRRIYWALAAVAAYARRQGASGRIMLVAGFRSPESTNLLRASGGGASSNSFHMRGRAADIQVEGMPTEEVAGYAQWLQLGGVGYYPDEGFTHIDTGPVRLWQA